MSTVSYALPATKPVVREEDTMARRLSRRKGLFAPDLLKSAA